MNYSEYLTDIICGDKLSEDEELKLNRQSVVTLCEGEDNVEQTDSGDLLGEDRVEQSVSGDMLVGSEDFGH